MPRAETLISAQEISNYSEGRSSPNCLRDKMTAVNPLLPVREVNVNDALHVF